VFNRFKRSLMFKLLLVLSLILTISFTIVSLSVFRVQSSVLTTMSQKVNNKLSTTDQDAQARFTTLEDIVAQSFSGITINAVKSLSDETAEALLLEEQQIKSDMELLVKTNGEILSNLLKEITLTFLVEENYSELRKHSRLASESDAVVYVMYLDAEGVPMPGYLDTMDNRIIDYLEKQPGEKDFQAVLVESRKDPNVIVYEKDVDYIGEVQGSIVVCIALDNVNKQLKALSSRFEAIRLENSTGISQILSFRKKSLMSLRSHFLSKGEIHGNVQD